MKIARTEELVDRDLFTCIQTYSSKNTRKIFKNIIHKDWNSVGSINQKKQYQKQVQQVNQWIQGRQTQKSTERRDIQQWFSINQVLNYEPILTGP